MTSSKRLHTFALYLLAVLLAWYWQAGITPASQKEQWLLVALSLLLLGASLWGRKKLTSEWHSLRPLLVITSVAAAYLLLFYSWNYVFRWYSDHHSYTGNIFRGAFYGFRAPFYGHLYPDHESWFSEKHWPAIFASGLFIVFAFWCRKTWGNLRLQPPILLLVALVVTGFAWLGSWQESFSSSNCHYESFAEDLNRFKNPRHLLATYNLEIHNLSVHNNHYTPGNLLLLMLEQKYWPYLAKSLCLIAVLLALWPLNQLLELWKFSTGERNLSFMLYSSSGAILFYPGIAMSPLMLPVAITAMYLMLKGFQRDSLWYYSLFGLVLAVFCFFTFSALVFGLFCAVMLGFLLLWRQLSLGAVLRLLAFSLTSFTLVFVLVHLLFNFNILECFALSLKNEQHQMDYSGIGSWPRYLITSTGNLLAYLGIIGLPSLGLFLYAWCCRRPLPLPLKILMYSLALSLVLLSFSNQFFLEVERIWIFLTPFALLPAGWIVGQFFNDKKYHLSFSLLLLAMLSTLLLSLNIDHCF